ncbi:PREDICTED: uncharacterized protein LOC105569660 isoform X2 [Vollenhovia emeryi]|uniref:uncharacterized protein LOC105569660 isoform X2 n=1 Tax=Vollenhovia emeryi TaxID=411798 RepID=UPI0005F4D30A|nr:PREDICTED: uncharacterized protein LOC105569660 isoform X2 [Vollenhovia emeryi]
MARGTARKGSSRTVPWLGASWSPRRSRQFGAKRGKDTLWVWGGFWDSFTRETVRANCSCRKAADRLARRQFLDRLSLKVRSIVSLSAVRKKEKRFVVYQ